MQRPPAIMFQGTGSDVGKSLIVAGLCRAFTRQGLQVRPFKPQNMSNNAAVTADGGEIGRAQALQARACGVPPHTDMNPVLLKPQSDTGAQLIVNGRVEGTVRARDYHALKSTLLPRVLDSFARLSEVADLTLVEGAGSPAEINLRAGDIANMGFAEAAGVPVVLIGDIERGGVIASLVGTVELLIAVERALLKGFIVNKFRGEASLFGDGMREIASRTRLAALGLVPWFAEASRLPAEDTASLDSRHYGGEAATAGAVPIKIAVPKLPRIANFDDLDPLAAEPNVRLQIVEPGRALPGDADVVLLAGSKATLADLAALRAQGWDIDIAAHVRRGGRVIGLCGGYQMLGRSIADPDGVEGPPGTAPGLGLLDVETTLEPTKVLRTIAATDRRSGVAVRGYEMHMGRTAGPDTARPWLVLDGSAEGAESADGRIAGCYLHGLFAADDYRQAFLRSLGAAGAGVAFDAMVEQTLDRLADHLATAVDLPRILEIARAR
jgi:adenosylcobyric acid synthase